MAALELTAFCCLPALVALGDDGTDQGGRRGTATSGAAT